MTSVNFYEIKPHKTKWKCELSAEENWLYNELYQTIVTKDYVKFTQITAQFGDFNKWINCVVLMEYSSDSKEPRKGGGSRAAMTLCHLAALNNARDIMKVLLQNGGDLSKQFVEIIERNNRKLVHKETVFMFIMIHFREPVEFIKSLLDESISCKDKGNDYQFELNFSIFCPTTNRTSIESCIEEETIHQMSVLNAILNSTDDVHSEQYELLKHPLVESFLTCKWKHYRRFFFLLVFIHLAFVSFISSAVILLVKSLQWFQKESVLNLVTRNFTQFETGTVEHSRLVEMSDKFYCIMEIIRILDVLAFVFAVPLFIHAVIQARFIPVKKLLSEFEILLNLVTGFCSMIVCISLALTPYEGYFDPEYEWIYQVASFLILPVWIDLMLIIGRFPRLGCYSLMFTTVLVNFLKVMISFIFLIIGFALSFSLLFPNSEFFKDPVRATLRTIVMMVGEFDYMATFSDAENNTSTTGTSRVIFLLFIISCSIILMNLTQGIAVNDIKLLHEISQVVRLEKETRFLYELECVFTHPFIITHPFFRKIKRKLYDHGTKIEPVKVSRDQMHGLSSCVYGTLVKDYKPRI